MWELYSEESWVLKNWCFWSVVLEKTLESPLDCKEINQSIPKEMSPGCSLEGVMLKLKLQYFGSFMQRVKTVENTLMLGRIGAGGERVDRGWNGWVASPTRWTWVWVNSGNWSWTGRPGVLWFMELQRVWHNGATELNWLNWHDLQWCVWLEWLKFTCLATFTRNNTALLTTVTMRYLRSSGLMVKVCAIWPTSPHSSPHSLSLEDWRSSVSVSLTILTFTHKWNHADFNRSLSG